MSRERKMCLFIVGDGVPDIPFGKNPYNFRCGDFLFKGKTSVFWSCCLRDVGDAVPYKQQGNYITNYNLPHILIFRNFF